MEFGIDILILLLVLLAEIVSTQESECYGNNCTLNRDHDVSRILSRRKRYLLFPDGSSFQLVYCTQTSALITIGDIFLYGSTAALAWMLPTQTQDLYLSKSKESMRRGDNLKGEKEIRRPFIYPVFVKRSAEESKLSYKEKLKLTIDRMSMHEKSNLAKKNLYDNLDEHSIEFHRSSRIGLFEKMEILITALGQDGRGCVLRKLCESAKYRRQGTFQQEFLRAVFSLPQGKPFEKDEHRKYDEAYNAEDCDSIYPECQ